MEKLPFYFMRIAITLLLLLTYTLSAQTKKFTFYYSSGKKVPRNYNQFKDSVSAWSLVTESISVISINGYADSKGSVQSNLKLSEKRAGKADDLLKTLNLRYKTYKAKGFGEEQPAATNATISGRSKNRRVEIELLLTMKPKIAEPVLVISPAEIKPKKDCDERDTLIILPGGTEIEIAGCSLDGVKLSEIKIDAEEFFDKDKMIQNDMFTQTSDGRCLSTGGMLKLRITDKNGNPVKLKPKKDLTIRIPKISADTAFDLYQMKTDKKENVGWEKRDEKITYKKEAQKFEFKMSDPVISLNLDFLPKPLGGLVKRKTFLKTRVVKNAKVYMNGGESVLRMKKLRPRRFDLRGCNCIPLNQQYVTAFAKKGGKTYYCHKKLSELKRRVFINQRFIVRKRDYIVLDDKKALELQMKGDFAQR